MLLDIFPPCLRTQDAKTLQIERPTHQCPLMAGSASWLIESTGRFSRETRQSVMGILWPLWVGWRLWSRYKYCNSEWPVL